MAQIRDKTAYFFSLWAFFLENSQFTVQQENEEANSLTPLYQIQSPHRHLDIIQKITAKSSPLHIASSQT